MPKPPPTHPEIAGAQRFFARARSFDIECPHCGLVYQIRADTNPTIWNPRTAIFRCMHVRQGGCKRQYVIGILAWPKGTGMGAGTPPADQVPGPRQLAQLRPEKDAWWMTDEYKHIGRPEPTNLTGELDRPAEEDPIDVDLAIYDQEEHPRCLICLSEYNPLKSKARQPERYCSMTCENRERL